MNLPEAIAAVDELTGRLEAALDADELETCEALLAARAEALRHLAARLRAAGGDLPSGLQADLGRLAARDAALRQRVERSLERLRGELARVGAAPRRPPKKEPGVFDRRA